MSFYEDDEEELDQELDEEEEDEDTLKELNVDDHGHVIEGRFRRHSRDDEYEDEVYE